MGEYKPPKPEELSEFDLDKMATPEELGFRLRHAFTNSKVKTWGGYELVEGVVIWDGFAGLGWEECRDLLVDRIRRPLGARGLNVGAIQWYASKR